MLLVVFEFFLDLHLCFYQGSATTFTQGHCYINYTKLIDYYLTMWAPDKLTPVALNGELFRCTNNQDAVNAVLMCRDNFDPLNLTYYTVCNDVSLRSFLIFLVSYFLIIMKDFRIIDGTRKTVQISYCFLISIVNRKILMSEIYGKLIVNIKNEALSAKIRSSHLQIFLKISVLKSLAKFTGVFLCKFWEVCRNTFFIEHLWVTASERLQTETPQEIGQFL